MKHNFFAGPAILPRSVIEKAAESVLDFEGMGLSILEISHRSSEFMQVQEQAEQNVRDILGLTDDFAVLFLTGGASSQFFMTVMNLLDPTDKASYLDTGSWSKKSIKEAQQLADIEVVASSAESNYSYIPKQYSLADNSKYFHITTNNTIFGTQHQKLPEVNVPLVCDMSSDVFSRPFPINRIGLIYAGSQKNMGPAGTTLVVVRKDLLGRVSRKLPTMLNYSTHIDKGSMFNTPPVFPIYVSKLYLDWVKAKGGAEAMLARNTEKAGLLYNEIDANPCFKGTAAEEDRSLMNACFLATDDRYIDPFLDACKEAGIVGVKGHRSVGGFRASIYNAMEKSSVEVLVEVMKDFATQHA